MERVLERASYTKSILSSGIVYPNLSVRVTASDETLTNINNIYNIPSF
jgi:hypothetical protein